LSLSSSRQRWANVLFSQLKDRFLECLKHFSSGQSHGLRLIENQAADSTGKMAKEICLLEWETTNSAGGEFSFEVRARKRTNGLFTIYVWWTHNFRFEEGIPITTERTRWHKNIKSPQQFIEGLDDCIDHLRDFNFEGTAIDEHVIERFMPELLELDENFTQLVRAYLENSQLGGNYPKIAGGYPLRFNVQNRQDSETYQAEGELSICTNLDLIEEPFFFSFEGTFIVPNQEVAVFSIDSKTWAGFLEAFENCEYGKIPKDLIEREIRKIPQLNGYLNWLDR